MPEPRRHYIAFRLGAEVLFWLCLPAVFLAIYVQHFGAPTTAVFPHLGIVGLLFLILALLRLSISRWIPNTPGRWMAAVLTTTLGANMLLYYVLVLVGLDSWGRVISWGLITTYSAQAIDLAASLGLSAPLVATSIGAAFLGSTVLAFLYQARFDWAPLLARRLSTGMLAVTVASGFAIAAIKVYEFTAAPWTDLAEPVSLTLFQRATSRSFQNNVIKKISSAKHDQQEDAARAAYQTTAKVAHRNVIIIVVDALRPDHLGVNGYARDTTPHLSKLAQSGRLRNLGGARASCSESTCGLFSMASSKYLHQLSPRVFTLYQALKHHGYRIHLVLGGDHTNFYGLREMYGDVDSYFDGSMIATRHYMNDDQLVIDHLEGFPSADGTPVMMQFHLMSTHSLGPRKSDAMRYRPAKNYALASNRNRSDVINFYDNGVVQADAVIARLLEILEYKGYLKDALVVVTADHGEQLGEHGIYMHGKGVYEPVLRVPLMFLAYGYQPAQAFAPDRLPTQVDIAPTILTELGMPLPTTWSGKPLQQADQPPFGYFQQGAEAGLIDHRHPGHTWKYWLNGRSGDEHAYELNSDPAEYNNKIDGVAAALKQEWRRGVLPGAALAVDTP